MEAVTLGLFVPPPIDPPLAAFCLKNPPKRNYQSLA